MTLCSLIDILKGCQILRWPTKSSIELKVRDQKLHAQGLRDLVDLGVNVLELSHPKQANLLLEYRKGSVVDFAPDTKITLSLPREVDKAVVATDLEDLLSISSTKQKAPRTYLLVSEENPAQSFCFVDGTSLIGAPESVKNYHAAIRLWGLLEGQSDYPTPNNGLMFFRFRRMEIQPRFEVINLNNQIRLSVEKISEFLGKLDLKTTRAEIFRSVLSDFMRDQSPANAFSYLLGASEHFVLRLGEGLAIYLADNSPEKLSEKAKAKYFELAEKLEKVISGMEAKSLTIPVAVLFAVKEMKAGEGWVTLNVIVLLSTLLYLIAMVVAYFSQKEILSLLKTTIAKAKSDLMVQGLSQNNSVLTENFKNLENRLKYTTRASRIMVFLSFGPLAAAIYAAFLVAAAPKPGKWPEPSIIPAAAIEVSDTRSTRELYS